MNEDTQGKTTNPIINQEENKNELLRIKTGALSVLSYPPASVLLFLGLL